MKAKFICHPDFAKQAPIQVFHKEMQPFELKEAEDKFLNRHILFRKQASFSQIKSAILRISADDYYKLYINGRFVTQGPAPAYPWAYYYNEIDVTEYLQEGENTFAVHTYYQGLINRVWVSGDRRQMLYFFLLVNGDEQLVSDESWRCHDHNGYLACGRLGYDTAFAECYDSGVGEAKFWQTDFDDSDWGYAGIYEYADYQLIKQPTKQLEIYEIEPVEVLVRNIESNSDKLQVDAGLQVSVCVQGSGGNTQRSDKVQASDEKTILVDFGQEAVGYVKAKAHGKKGDCIRIRCGEELNEDGSVRYDMRCNCNYEEWWILSGEEDELQQYDYKAFRYVELQIPIGVELTDISMLVRHYPYEQKAKYNLNDTDLEEIIQLCANTIKYGTQECFVDCPTREKGQYLGDVSIAGRAHAVLTGDTTMMKKAIREFAESAFICPGVMAVANASLMQEIADYSLQLPAQILWVYRYDNDLEFVKEMMPTILGIQEYFLKYTNKQGLLEGVTEKWNLVDWPANLRDDYDFELTIPVGKGIHNVLNAFWCGFLEAVDTLCGIVGVPAFGLCERAKRAFYHAFYSEETGVYVDAPGSRHTAIHSAILPLLFEIGMQDTELKKRMIQHIGNKGLTSAGVYMAYFALAALVKHGEVMLAKELAKDAGCWKNMLAEGATTTYEAWGKEQKWNTSLFHPWAVAPVIVFAEGVEPY